MELLKGISVDVRMNLWKKFADVVLKLIENGDIDPSILPIVGGIAPAFLLKINGNLDLTIDDHMKQKITENPLVEPVLLDAKTLIDSVSGRTFDTEEEFFQWVENDIPAPFNDLASVFSRFLGDEVELYAGSEIGGARVTVQGEGL